MGHTSEDPAWPSPPFCRNKHNSSGQKTRPILVMVQSFVFVVGVTVESGGPNEPLCLMGMRLEDLLKLQAVFFSFLPARC